MTPPAGTKDAPRQRWELRDASGVHLVTHVRVDNPDGSKAVFWVHPDGRRVSDDLPMPLVDLPLYGVHRLDKSATVVVCEGEKAADALFARDIMALGTVTGASATPSRIPLGDLTGRHVILWPDNDEVGEDHMRRLAANLTGIAASVRWAVWDGAPAHGDAADYPGEKDPWDVLDAAGPVPSRDMTFERRGLGYYALLPEGRVEITLDRIRHSRGETHGEITVRSGHHEVAGDGHLMQGTFNVSSMTTRGTLAKALAERAPRVKNVDWRGHLEAFCRAVLAAEREGSPIVTIGGTRPLREATPYLLNPILFRHRATILYGPGGTGKSYLAAGVVVAVETGSPDVIDGFRPSAPARCLILDWEADADEWNERLTLVARGAGLPTPEPFYRFCAAPLTDQLEDVSRFIVQHGIGLVVVDSVGMASPASHEGGDANEGATRFFGALRHMRTTALLIDHVTGADAGSEKGAYKPYGSVYKVNLARATFELRREDDESNESVGHLALINRKVNNARKAKPIGLVIEHGPDYVRFDSEEVMERESFAQAVPLTTRIEDALRTGPLSRKEIVEETRGNSSSVGVTLSRMVERGLLVHLSSGQYALKAREVA